MRTYLLFAVAGALLIVALQLLLPHNLAPARSTQVLGLLHHELRSRPRGIVLTDLTSFPWDEVCVVRPEVLSQEVPALLQIDATTAPPPPGNGWLLLFLDDDRAVTATRVPPSTGALDQREDFLCIRDRRAFFTVLEPDGHSKQRRFVLRV